MKSHARVVVIGGGVTGCSVLYHLALKGWSDVVLCERTELTAGSTWHSAGHVILYTMSPCISRLNQYGVCLYTQLEAQTGQNPGFHACGNMRIATHPDRLKEFQRYIGVAETTGVRAEIIGPGEVGQLWPMMETDGIYAAVFNPQDGHIAPADLTQALAAGARKNGAGIYRQTEVTGLARTAGGEWRVETDKGVITAEHVVSCTGNYTLQTLDMVGMKAQAIPVKHQYIVTDAIPELVRRREQGLPEIPVMRDPEQSFYVRQEGLGLAMGCYEEKGECVFTDGVPDTFGQDLFADELDKLLPYLERAAERIPALGEVGLKDVINGPMPYTPDDMPICGPAFGQRNLWLAEGNPFGITLAGGIGWQMAEWIVEGEPSIDMWPCDSRRYGDWANRMYSVVKTEEAYERTYLLPKPGEELPAGRPLKTTPLHDLLSARGAVFGEVYGWERPRHFGDPTAEYRQLSEGCSMADISHDARFRISGDGAAKFLDSLVCTTLPQPGDAAPAYVLTGSGKLRSAWRLYREKADCFLVTAPANAERLDLDLLQKTATSDNVCVENMTGRLGGLGVIGPKAAGLLAATGSVRHGAMGLATATLITIGKGFEVLTEVENLRHIFLALEEAGAGLHGTHVVDSMRLEAGEAAWGSEINREFTPLEAGLEDVVAWEKGDFRGRAALLAKHKSRPQCQRVSLIVAGESIGREPVRIKGGRQTGKTTSGGHCYGSARNYAMAYIDATLAADTPLEINITGEWIAAEIVSGSGTG